MYDLRQKFNHLPFIGREVVSTLLEGIVVEVRSTNRHDLPIICIYMSASEQLDNGRSRLQKYRAKLLHFVFKCLQPLYYLPPRLRPPEVTEYTPG